MLVSVACFRAGAFLRAQMLALDEHVCACNHARVGALAVVSALAPVHVRARARMYVCLMVCASTLCRWLRGHACVLGRARACALACLHLRACDGSVCSVLACWCLRACT